MKLTAGDSVKVRYSHDKFFTGKVLWTEHNGIDWAVVRPDDQRMIATFGSAHDMSNGYKRYIYNDPILGAVERVADEVYSPFETVNS